MMRSDTFLPSRWVSQRVVWQALAYFFFWVELRLFTDLRGRYGPYWSPVFFYGAGVLLCVCALLALRDQPPADATDRQVARRQVWAGAALLLGGAAVLYKQVPIVLGSPIDVRVSDVIPIVQNYVARFRSGEVVYRYLTNLPYPLFPNHLPLQWLPYVPAQPLGIDYRWVALGLLLLAGFGAYQLALLRQAVSWPLFVVKALLPAYVLVQMLRHDAFLFAQVLEPTIICYYFLLAASVLSRSVWAQAGALVLCLLSRYSVIFWVPFFLFVLWREAGRRHALLVAGLVLAGIVGIYVVPFLAKDPTIFTHALAEYRTATLGEWGRPDGPVPGQPVHVFNGLSAAAWFYTHLGGSLEHKITAFQRLHVVASAGAVALFAFFYWRQGRRYDYRRLALVGLKFYLATFYFFIQIPYAYLVALSVMLSVFVVLAIGGGRATPPASAATAPASRT